MCQLRTPDRDCDPASRHPWSEIREARTHVPRHVLHHDGDTVRFRIQFAEEFFFADLRQRSVRKPLVAVIWRRISSR